MLPLIGYLHTIYIIASLYAYIHMFMITTTHSIYLFLAYKKGNRIIYMQCLPMYMLDTTLYVYVILFVLAYTIYFCQCHLCCLHCLLLLLSLSFLFLDNCHACLCRMFLLCLYIFAKFLLYICLIVVLLYMFMTVILFLLSSAVAELITM